MYSARPARRGAAAAAAAAALVASICSVADAFGGDIRVCGNYCGPGWCNAAYIEEEDCDDSAPVETWKATGASCADSCCKVHDACCGHGQRSTCNPQIVNCLNKCNSVSVSCTRDGIGVPAAGIWAAMRMVKSYCCSTPCNADPQFLDAGGIVARRVQLGGSAVLEQLGVLELRQLAAAVDTASQVVLTTSNASTVVVGAGKRGNNTTNRSTSSSSGDSRAAAAKSKWEVLAEVNEETGHLLNEPALRKELHTVLLLRE